MRICIAFFCLSLTTIVCASPVIKGIVKDAETKEPIPFAHIVVGDIISLSNIDGEFVIEAYSSSEKFNLQVSVMGYELEDGVVEDATTFQTVLLKPSTVQLDEVTIMSWSCLDGRCF